MADNKVPSKSAESETSRSSSICNESDLVQAFQQLTLTDMQRNVKVIRPDEFAQLVQWYRSKVQEDKEKNNTERRVEQAVLAIPLWILAQTKPEHLESLEYISLVQELTGSVKHILSLLHVFLHPP